MTQWIVLYGNLGGIDGAEGPFDTEQAARDYAQDQQEITMTAISSGCFCS